MQYQHRAPKRDYSDFRMYYATGQRFLSGQEIYTFEGDISYFKYTPFYAFLIAPLTLMSKRLAASVWFLLNVIFLLTLFYSLKELIVVDKHKFKSYSFLYTLTFIAMARFLIGNFHQGQANIFMMTLFFVGLYYWMHKRETLASFFIAFSIMIKYMTILFLPYLIIRKKFKLFWKIIMFVAVLYLLPILAVGLERTAVLLYQQLNFVFKSSLDKYSITCYPNQSLLAMLNRFLTRNDYYSVNIVDFSQISVFFIFFLFAFLLYFLAVIPLFKKKHKEFERFYLMVDVALISICISLFNPNAWRYFFIWLLPAYMLVVYYLKMVCFKDKFVFMLTLSSFILISCLSEFFVGERVADVFEIYSSTTFGALLLFFAILKIKFTKVPRHFLVDSG